MLRVVPMLLFALPVAAQDTIPTRLTVDLGFVNTAGNSDVTTLNVGEKLEHAIERLTLTQSFSVVYARTDGITNTSQWRAGVRADYQLAGPLAAFALGAFERNTFAGIERRFEEAVGLAARLLTAQGNTLTGELGASLNQQTPVGGTVESFMAGRAALMYRRNLSATAYTTLDGEFLPNLETTDDYRINAAAALVAPISTRLATKLGYAVRYDNVPEAGFATTDRIFTAGLQVTF
jgi:putative salt-induced outer membrane protein YdiY